MLNLVLFMLFEIGKMYVCKRILDAGAMYLWKFYYDQDTDDFVAVIDSDTEPFLVVEKAEYCPGKSKSYKTIAYKILYKDIVGWYCMSERWEEYLIDLSAFEPF